MAATVKVKAAIAFTQGNLTVAHSRDMTTTTTGDHEHSSIQDIGFAAHEALVIPAEIGTAKWAYFMNMDATHFVQVGLDVTGAFVPFVKLEAGEACVVPMATDAIYAKADTAAVKLYFLISEA